MIEHWLQVTCDKCGEIDNSPLPNMTIKEFLDWNRFVKRGKKHLCPMCARP